MGREGLVRYVGHRRGKFNQRVGAYPARTWCVRQPWHEKWLPEAEALLWERGGPWRVLRWRQADGQAAPIVGVVASPAPPAVHVATALEQAEMAAKEAAKKQEIVDASFVMSNSGIVHLAGCANGPKRPYKTFSTLERAMADEDFSKAHQPCCKKHLKELNSVALMAIHERRDEAVSQMNTMGEDYGLEQDEA